MRPFCTITSDYPELRMQTVIVIVCVALLLWIKPASAEDYSLKVRVHKDLQVLTSMSMQQLTEKVDSILREASMRLKAMDEGNCNVTLKRDGRIETFESAPNIIRNPNDLEAVHRVPGHVKIVDAILSCIGQTPDNGFVGCSFRPNPRLRKTMIVNGGLEENERPNIWAHEFGHTTGLHHRKVSDPNDSALMTPCAIKSFSSNLTRRECRCLRAGPNNGLGACNRPDTQPMCPDQRR